MMTEGQQKEPVSFRGTRMGVMVSITEEGSFTDNLMLLRNKLEENHQLFRGSGMSLDLGWRELHPEEMAALQDFLSTQGIRLQGIISTSLTTRKLAESIGIKVIIGRLGLSEHYSRTSKKDQEEDRKPCSAASQEETLMLRKTIRSGQKIEFSGNVVIQGDVNPGGEVIATGDIIVLGALRGVAHAGSGGSEASIVLALSLESTQLRIARHIAIAHKVKKNSPMHVRVDEGKIIVAPPMIH